MEAFKFIDVKQNTDEWFALRGGLLTSSNLNKIMANFGKTFGEPAKNYAWTIANEQVTGEPISSNYSNAHMERGHEEEPIASMIYENQTFCDVTNGGFFQSGFVGCSPDGLVGDNGVIEIKSVISNVQGKNVKRQGLDPAYKWQFIGNLKFTGRDWLDFISYCSTYPEGKQIFIHRIRKEDFAEEFKMLDDRIAEFKKLVEECKKCILESKYDNY